MHILKTCSWLLGIGSLHHHGNRRKTWTEVKYIMQPLSILSRLAHPQLIWSLCGVHQLDGTEILRGRTGKVARRSRPGSFLLWSYDQGKVGPGPWTTIAELQWSRIRINTIRRGRTLFQLIIRNKHFTDKILFDGFVTIKKVIIKFI